MLNALFVTYSRILVGSAGVRFSRILTTIPVHVIEMFGLRVVRLQFIVADWPGRRGPAVVSNLAKIFFAQTEQRGAVEFRVAADVIICVWMEGFAVLVVPGFFRVVLRVEIYSPRAPVIFLARHIVAALEQQDFLAGWRELVSQSAAARAGSDNDYVVVVVG